MPDISLKKKLLSAAAVLFFAAGLVGLKIAWMMFSVGLNLSFGPINTYHRTDMAKMYGVMTVLPVFPLLAGWHIWFLVRKHSRALAPEYRGLMAHAGLVLGIAVGVLALFVFILAEVGEHNP